MLAWAIGRAHELAGLVAALGAIGAIILLAALWRAWEELLPWPLAMLGAAYAATLFLHHHAVDDGAPLVAAGLLLCGELAAWSLDERLPPIRAEAAVTWRRATALGALTLAGLAAATAVVAVAGAGTGSGLVWTTLGAAAAVGAVGVGVALLRRTGGGPLH